MDQKILDKINEALDYAMERFQEDPDCIFSSEIERRKLKHQNRSKSNKWKKKKHCIYDTCNKKSIPKSHTIQKSTSISIISEKSHVLRPRFNSEIGKMEMISEGINEASTFPGFCEDHERLFEEFENQKDLTKQNHFVLQTYRTICRELVIAENNLEVLTNDIKIYTDFRNEKIEEMFAQKLGPEFLSKNDITLNGLELKNGDHKEKIAENGKKTLVNYINSLQALKKAITNDLRKKKFQQIFCFPIVLDYQLPVTIAGRGNFRINTQTKTKSAEVIFNVLPHKDKTYIVLSGLRKHTNLIKLYASQFVNPLQIISLIERWMIHGSDHWFINPSTWNKIDTKRQDLILEIILDESRNIGHDFEYSIFDDIRIEIIKQMDEYKGELDPRIIELRENERCKLP
jgi:hypothetical protein